MAFVEARIAVRSGDVLRAGTLVVRADAAVVAGLPDAAEHLPRIELLAAEHRWAAACLARARGRMERDPDAIAGRSRSGNGGKPPHVDTVHAQPRDASATSPAVRVRGGLEGAPAGSCLVLGQSRRASNIRACC